MKKRWNNKKSLWRHIGLSVASLVALLSVFPMAALAANSVGMRVSPVIVELNVKKGETQNVKLKVNNQTTSDQTYYPEVNDFEAKDETGTPELILDNKSPSTASIVKWVDSISPFTLSPNQSEDITLTIKVPANAEPGGHYGFVRFSTQPASTTKTGASLVASAGTLVLVRVEGDTKENLQITDFYTQRKGKKVSMFETGPVEFVERITNSGNVHVKPTGSIVVTDMLGRQIADLKINDNKGNILPNSTRRFEQRLDRKWMFGRYSAKMIATYGTNGGSLNSTLTFWVIPYKLIALAILALVLIIFLIKKATNRRDKKIIEKALKEKQQSTPDKKD